jgi:hypothetical protein
MQTERFQRVLYGIRGTWDFARRIYVLNSKQPLPGSLPGMKVTCDRSYQRA